MRKPQVLILFSPLPVDACRSRLEDATLPVHGSSIAGRVRSRTIELWRRQTTFRFFQPTIVLHLFGAGERTRLETRMTVSASGIYGPISYGVCVGSSALITAFGWVPLGLALLAFETATIWYLRRRGGRALPADGPFLREQLGVLVHATEPAR